jgi:hypothetical protein
MQHQSKIAVLCSLFLAGCNTTTVLDKPVLVDRTELIVPQVQPVSQSNMQWIVITPDNAAQKMKELQADGVVTVLALTPDGYKNLSMNVAELRRYIQQQHAVIAAYQEYYKNETKKQQ